MVSRSMQRLLAMLLILCLLIGLVGCGRQSVKEYGVSVTDTDAYTAQLRPSYHYTAYNSWINDPNGLVYFNGTWHMYYQTNPEHNFWGSMTWGHAVSDDLVHWVEQTPVLWPDMDGDMFSGTGYVDLKNRSGFFKKSGIVAAYSTSTQHIGIAYSEDGYNFEKVGIVLSNPGISDFRDPKLFWHAETSRWIMVIAGGLVRIYSSADLKNWRKESVNFDIDTECPDLFPLKIEGTNQTRWVLTCSSRGYYIGSFDGHAFTPETEYIPMNEGPDSYAGIIFDNATGGRKIMLNWVQNWAYTTPPDGIWSGAMSLPVEITLRDVKGVGLRLCQKPVAEVACLERDALISCTDVTGSTDLLKGIHSNAYHMTMSFDTEQTDDFTLELCKGIEDVLTVSYRASDRQITVDRSGLSGSIAPLKENGAYAFQVADAALKNGILDLDIYVDTSTFELFAAEGLYYLTQRIQPFTGSQGMALLTDGKVAVKELTVKPMESIWFGNQTDQQSYLHLGKYVLNIYDGQPQVIPAFGKTPEGGEIIWSVADPSIVQLTPCDGGVTVTPLTEGATDIYAECGGHRERCSVTVADPQ